MLQFTLAEAATVLQPAITERQLRQIITALGWQPDGSRRNGHRGRPVATYEVSEIMKLHAVLAPWLEMPYAKPDPTGLPESEPVGSSHAGTGRP